MSISLKRKLEADIEIRATAADVHYEICSGKPHNISHAAPHFIQAVDLHEGDHGKVGSKCAWKYTLGGKPLVVKSVLEEIDEEKKLVKYRAIEGDMLDEYKTFCGTCQVIPKDEKNCIVKYIFEYEKLHSGVPEPTAWLDAWLAATIDMDDHHHGIKK
ncbi:hypothetical protein BVRB_8g196540 [Beta vulgaris subsp. vulgaris]|uniref:MLP-like protein 31 n=1 Tax=Beta vulgaris subsp. vulgaris TaxID=3555 RepID=UPI00065C449E|nr:MLP-like protein 31 [Beta vulgaris subsp. vulgaris]KMT03096.1 hypothetical protein BVRB_8g196540 [Beta vulgaris subsp. vulgaris]